MKWEIKLKNSKKCFFIIDNEVIKSVKKIAFLLKSVFLNPRNI